MRNLSLQILWLLCLFPFPISTSVAHNPLKLHTMLKNYRGGALDLKKNEIPSDEIVTVWILSKFGNSDFLEKRIKLDIHKNSTIGMVKSLVSEHFPGRDPPSELQNLFFGLQRVENSQKLFEISEKKIIPLQLDLISSVKKDYQKIKNVVEALEAYVALQIHDIFLSQTALRLLSPPASSSSSFSILNETDAEGATALPQSIAFMELFRKLNQSLFESQGTAIHKAVEAERELTSFPTDDLRDATIDGLGYETIDEYLDSSSKLRRFLTTELSFNRQILRSLVLYSLVWIVSALLFFPSF
jgi:hypothetical protein